MPKLPYDYYTTFEMITKWGINVNSLPDMAKKNNWQVRKFSHKNYYYKMDIEKYFSLDGWISIHDAAQMVGCEEKTLGRFCKKFGIRIKDVKNYRYVYEGDLQKPEITEYLSTEGMVNKQQAIELLGCSSRDFNPIITANNIRTKTLFKRKYYNKSDINDVIRKFAGWISRKAAIKKLGNIKSLETFVVKHEVPQDFYGRHKVYLFPDMLNLKNDKK